MTDEVIYYRSGVWEATLHLRMKMPEVGDMLSNFTIQQLWVSRSGEKRWETIPKVPHDARDDRL